MLKLKAGQMLDKPTTAKLLTGVKYFKAKVHKQSDDHNSGIL